MTVETWNEARLIPTSGIKGAEEQERRATSALLAVMGVVREFGRSITKRLGAPAGDITTYIEVPFDLDDRRVFPDGLIRVTRGQRSWTALVEVKTGLSKLDASQLTWYLDVARDQGFDALLTISNEIPSIPGTHPTPVDRRKTKKVSLHHLSWTEVLTEAVVQKTYRGVSDPEQAWILGELIRYLEHPKSGAMEFEDMGGAWPSVREAVRAGTLRSGDKGALDVAAHWDQLVQYICLRLGRRLGVEVEPALTRKELDDPSSRAASVVQNLERTGQLTGGLRIPGAVGPVTLTADLRAQLATAAVEVAAPRDGRPATRVNWLLRQLREAPDDVRVDVFAAHARGASTSELLREARAKAASLVADPKREIRTFRVAASTGLGSKRGVGRGSFIGGVLDLVDEFYGSVVQHLRPWAAPPPKLRQADAVDVEPEVEPELISTALSSQDGVDGSVGGEPAEEPVTQSREAPAEQEQPVWTPPWARP